MISDDDDDDDDSSMLVANGNVLWLVFSGVLGGGLFHSQSVFHLVMTTLCWPFLYASWTIAYFADYIDVQITHFD